MERLPLPVLILALLNRSQTKAVVPDLAIQGAVNTQHGENVCLGLCALCW